MAEQPNLKPAQLGAYRAIAPSMTPPKTLTCPKMLDMEKRKRNDADHSGLTMNKMQRRGSASSQGCSNTTSLAADQRKRRKEQNRAAQRAFRERKEQYVKELEDKIKKIETAHAAHICRIEKENSDLKSALRDIQNKLSNPSNNNIIPSQSPTSSQSSPPPYSDTRSPVVSANSTPAAVTPRVASSAVACIRDKDGVSFCERLKKEVCSNAYDRLLTEPLFDAQGYLNETVVSRPVPIITSAIKEQSKIDVFNELEQFLTERMSLTTDTASTSTNSVDLISCSEVWQRIAKHPMFDQFDTDELCDELRRRAKCSRNGPVFEVYEVQEVLDLMVSRLKPT